MGRLYTAGGPSIKSSKLNHKGANMIMFIFLLFLFLFFFYISSIFPYMIYYRIFIR